MFSEKLADYGVKLVESLDVELLCGAKISEVAPGKVIYEKDGQTSSLKAETSFGQQVFQVVPLLVNLTYKNVVVGS